VRLLWLLVCLFWLAGCAAERPMEPTGEPQWDALTMPAPRQMGRALWADQLLSAQFKGETRQVPVRLEIHPDRVLLAGFSGWGTRLFSLRFDGVGIDVDTLPGLDQTLPPAQRVLLDMTLALWPVTAWQASLAAAGWQLSDSEGLRQLRDVSGKLVMEIRYAQTEPLAGDIVLHNVISGYELTIKTLRWGSYGGDEFH